MVVGAIGFLPPTDAQMAERLSARPHTDMASRIVFMTEPLLGAPYLLSALGEGPGQQPDTDPRLRFDAFDCTTFVETALALALADDLPQLRRELDVLRYRSRTISFENRRHFPEAEWIPQLRDAGYLVDVTRDVGGDAVVVQSKHLDVDVWTRSKAKGTPDLPDARIPVGTFALDVWPLHKASLGRAAIRSGTLLNVVRTDRKSIPVRVTHQGIVIEKNGAQFLRHAADRMHHHVVDEPLGAFFDRMEKYARWPISGVNLMRIEEPANWRAQL